MKPIQGTLIQAGTFIVNGERIDGLVIETGKTAITGVPLPLYQNVEISRVTPLNQISRPLPTVTAAGVKSAVAALTSKQQALVLNMLVGSIATHLDRNDKQAVPAEWAADKLITVIPHSL